MNFKSIGCLVAAAAFLAATTGGCRYFQSTEKQLLSEDENARSQALRDVVAMSAEQRKKLVPALMKGLHAEDSRVINRAGKGLIAVGRPALEDLYPALTDKDVFVRITATGVIGGIGAHAEEAIPKIIDQLKDPHPLVRAEAARALGEIKSGNPQTFAALLTATRDTDPDVAKSAAESMEKLGVKIDLKTPANPS